MTIAKYALLFAGIYCFVGSILDLMKLNGKYKNGDTLRLWIRVLTVSFVIVFSAEVYLYAPVVFQRGNPFPYLVAAAKLGDDNTFVQVNSGETSTVNITEAGICDELLEYIAEGNNLPFQEQEGNTFIFSDGVSKLAVCSEIYWSKYTVWTVPDGKQ